MHYDLKLKCTGAPWTQEEQEWLKTGRCSDRCTTEFADDKRLQELYANALCFVFPSYYEGFGIPILEAFSCDCPLVLANASCFPEIAKDAAVYFDPKNVEDMREQIEKVVLSESLREELVKKGRERLKDFSWKKCAEETAKVYASCMNEKPIDAVTEKTYENKILCKICGMKCENIFDSSILKNYKADYFHCSDCGFLFAGNAQDWLAQTYEESINIEDTGIMMRNNIITEKLGLLLYYLFGNTGKYLDFAGGYGFLVRLMRDAGFDFYWADAYSKNLVARGFEGDLSGKYDVVTSFESFEHFLEPIKEIDKLTELSKIIIFSTDLLPNPIPKPNEWSYYGLSHGQHISFYSEKTLKKIAEKYNLEYADILGLHIFCEKNILEKIENFRAIINNQDLTRQFLQEYKNNMQSKTMTDYLTMAEKKERVIP